jgi:hypothetical protein
MVGELVQRLALLLQVLGVHRRGCLLVARRAHRLCRTLSLAAETLARLSATEEMAARNRSVQSFRYVRERGMPETNLNRPIIQIRAIDPNCLLYFTPFEK